MFIFKYALKSISRSLGRNILIGIIVLIIATAACVAMSIQQAAETAAANTLKGMSISANVYIDRGYLRQKAEETVGTSDMNELMPEMMSLMKEHSLDLEDMEEYSEIKKADSDEPLVQSYYYNASISISGEDINKYDLTASNTEETTAPTEAATEPPKVTPTVIDPQGNVIEAPAIETPTMPEMPQQEPQQMEKPGDFDLIGYNSYKAMELMESFGSDSESACTISQGAVFEDNTSEYECIIEENLATFNSLEVGKTIKLVNPKNEDETYSLKVVGIFKSSTGTMASGSDAANTIITSYNVVKDIETKSDTANNTSTTASDSSKKTDDASTSGSSDESDALISQFSGTFVFASVDDYEQFKDEVRNKAINDGYDGDMYIVTSGDVATFKAGLKPLENLKSFATTFLYLTLAIGAVVLIVISVISIRDRKYEIGVLAAMGIKKLKLSMMFMIEVLTITLVAILIGVVIGSAVSVPVTNNLLSAQIEQQEEKDDSQQTQQQPGQEPASMERPEDGEITGEVVYVDSVEFSVDIFVVLKMLAIGIALAVVSGFTSILFILRYDPKQILANRD